MPQTIGPRTRKQIESHLDTISACLDAGIALEISGPHGIRRFTAGQITRQIADDNGSVRTTHLRPNLGSYVWITRQGIAQLAAQAEAKLTRKDEILAGQQARFRDAMGRD